MSTCSDCLILLLLNFDGRLHILWLLLCDDRHLELLLLVDLLPILIRLVLSRRCEILERWCIVLLVAVHPSLLLLHEVLIVVNLLVLVELRLHWLEREVILSHLIEILLLAFEENSLAIGLVFHELSITHTILWRNDLNVAVIRKQLHVWWAVE